MRTWGVLAALLLLLGACGSGGDSEAAPTVTETVFVTVEPEPADVPEPAAEESDMPAVDESWLGSFDEPLPTGEAITLAAWGVTFGPTEVTTEALHEALSPAEPGMVHVWAPVEAFRTANTAGSVGSFDAGLNITVIGGSGVEILDVCTTDDDLDVLAEVHPGGAVTGLVCSYIPEDEAEGAVWRIHQQGLDAPAYVALR